MIIGIYLLTPIVIRFKNSISKRSFSIVVWVFLIWAGFSAWTTTFKLSWDIGKSFEYLGYFMAGYEIKQKCNKSNKKGTFFILLGLLFEIIIIPIQYRYIIQGISEKYSLIANYSPLIMISSIFLFIGFSNINVKKDLTKLSGLTFYIYIFHAFIWERLTIFINNKINVNLIILLGTIVVFILSYICSLLWIKIKNILNKNDRIYRKIDKIFDKFI